MKDVTITLGIETSLRISMQGTPGTSIFRRTAGLYIDEELFIREICDVLNEWFYLRFGENRYLWKYPKKLYRSI